ncbi:MAG: tRNA (guanosine(46)-N7)-methyltransferase TrmB [Ferruginibacter sp.]
MGQKKLQRFADIKTFANVLEYPEQMKGKWSAHFGNNNPIVLELACGRGEYTVALSQLFPDKNFIGVDVKGNRMYIGAKKCLELKQKNAAFLRTQIEMINLYFETDEVSEIWITFPDPQLRTSKAKKRLTHPRFLRLYKSILQPSGSIHLKTDSPHLYQFTQRVIELYGLSLVENIVDVHRNNPKPELKIKTHYEALDIAGINTVHYLQFALPIALPQLDEQLQNELKQTENQ